MVTRPDRFSMLFLKKMLGGFERGHHRSSQELSKPREV
jgi:hypothetical protein